jgi:hypothetical protein
VKPLHYALGYAESGYHVLPVRSLDDNGRCDCGGACGSDAVKWAKHPRTQHGWQDATTDPDQIRQWWSMWPNANVGIATLGDLVVIDLDPRHGSEQTWVELIRDRDLPPTLTAITGSGGLHYYFRGHVARQGHNALGAGIDVKAQVADRAGYVLAPPSRTVGGEYGWLTNGISPSPLPDWLHPDPPAKRQMTLPEAKGPAPSCSYALAALRSEARAASERRDGQGRRDGLFEAALKLSRLCPPLAVAEVVEVLLAAAAESGLSESEARSHIENGLATGFQAVGA